MCHQYTQRKKVTLAVTEFQGYASTWWDHVKEERRILGAEQIKTWPQLKTAMKTRFVPKSFLRETHQKLQLLKQGSKSVEEYYQELETTMVRLGLREDMESRMARYLQGLNMEIRHKMEIQPYEELADLHTLAGKAEKQLKETRRVSSSWRNSTPPTKPNMTKKFEGKKPVPTTTTKPTPTKDTKGTSSPNTSKTSNRTQCFRCKGFGHFARDCPNAKVMVIQEGDDEEDGEEENEIENEQFSSSSR